MHYELSWFDQAGHRRSIAITQDDFIRVRKDRQHLEQSANIERRLDIFLSNYVDFEVGIAKRTIELTVRQRFWEDPSFPSLEADRHLMNLLDSASGYRAQVLTHVRRAEQQEYKDLFEQRKRSSLACWILETLRNYSQHHSLPVHGVRVMSHWSFDESERPKQRTHGMQLFLDVAELNAGFSKDPSLLREIAAIADKEGRVELSPLIRRFVEDYSALNAEIRAKRLHIAIDARRIFQKFRDLVPTVERNGDYLEALACGNHTGATDERIYLGPELESALDHLVERNRHSLVNFRHVVYRS